MKTYVSGDLIITEVTDVSLCIAWIVCSRPRPIRRASDSSCDDNSVWFTLDVYV